MINKSELQRLAKERLKDAQVLFENKRYNGAIYMCGYVMINLNKYIKIEKELSKEYGPFYLFALFLREDSVDKWDILVASDWLQENKNKGIGQIAKKLQNELEKQELVDISRIVLIESDNPALKAFQKSIEMEHGNVEIKDSNLFGLQIKHAYIITSRPIDQKEPVAGI